VLMLAESLSCLPRLRVSDARSLPARSTSVSLPCKLTSCSAEFLNRFDQQALNWSVEYIQYIVEQLLE